MASSVLTTSAGQAALDELLQPDPRDGNGDREERVVVCGISWERYLAFDKKLGDDRPGPRLYYLDGELEIMTTSNEHERIKKSIASLMEVYFEETDIEIIPRGQATMRLEDMKKAGAEPDESYCIGTEKEFPDLVLEIALTSGGVSKLDIYARFKVPEVWLWRPKKLEILILDNSGNYESAQTSHFLPGLDTALLERCVAMPSWQWARRTFRAALAKRG